MRQRIFTDGELAQMKRDARRMSKATVLTHCQALEQIAQKNGYDSWKLLIAAQPLQARK